MKILVLLGGESPERGVSLLSGEAVFEALQSNKDFTVKKYDPIDGVKGLEENVNWADVVLPILHGINGEDGSLQKQIEELNTLFLGSGSSSARLSFDKKRTHQALSKIGIMMPEYDIVGEKDVDTHDLFKKTFVIKPNKNGSSVDVLIVRKVDKYKIQEAKELLKRYKNMLVEELIEGQEITVGVLGDEALPVIAIVPPVDGEFDMENKYNGKTQEICPAPEHLVSDDAQVKAQLISLRVHKALKAENLSRTDLIVTPDGEIYVLELNSIPGMTANSLYPKAARVAGYNMEQLTKKFVELARG